MLKRFYLHTKVQWTFENKKEYFVKKVNIKIGKIPQIFIGLFSLIKNENKSPYGRINLVGKSYSLLNQSVRLFSIENKDN